MDLQLFYLHTNNVRSRPTGLKRRSASNMQTQRRSKIITYLTATFDSAGVILKCKSVLKWTEKKTYPQKRTTLPNSEL